MFTKKKLSRISMILTLLLLAAMLIAPQLTSLAAENQSVSQSTLDQMGDTPLASYFPADTTLYFAMRTDDGFIETLDGVVNGLHLAGLAESAGIPTMGMPLTVRGLLDMGTQQLFQGDFASTVRPWLGDYAAFGLVGDVSDSAQTHALFVVDITAKDGALDFVRSNTPDIDTYTTTEMNGYTVIDDGRGTLVGLNDDVMIFSVNLDTMAFDGSMTSSLAANTEFTDAVSTLPESSYDLLLYFDAGLLFQLNAATQDLTQLQQFGIDLTNAGKITMGATILDGSALVFDVAQNSSMMIANMPMPSVGAINPDFTANLPADTNILLHGTNLKSIYDTTLALLQQMSSSDEMMQAQIEGGLDEVTTAIQQSTGLDLEQDILAWMTGDYAVFVSGTPPAPGEPYSMTSPMFPDEAVNIGLEFGLVMDSSSDPAKASAFVESLATLATDMPAGESMSVSREDIAGANALVFSMTDPSLAQPLEVVLAANDNVFVLGTRAAATAALEGSGGLNNAAVYQDVSRYMLDNTAAYGFISQDGIVVLGDLTFVLTVSVGDVFSNIVSGLEGGMTQEQLDQQHQEQADALRQQGAMMQQLVRDIAARFNNVTFSSAISNDGTTVSRLTILFAQ